MAMLQLENGTPLQMENGEPFELETADAPAHGPTPKIERGIWKGSARPRVKLQSAGKWRHGRRR